MNLLSSDHFKKKIITSGFQCKEVQPKMWQDTDLIIRLIICNWIGQCTSSNVVTTINALNVILFKFVTEELFFYKSIQYIHDKINKRTILKTLALLHLFHTH